MLYHRSIGTNLDLRFEPTHASASVARRTAREHLDDAGLAADVVADLELVIAELASNAVDQQPGAPIRLTLAIDPDQVIVTVANETTAAPTFPPLPAADPNAGSDDPLLRERGWGLGIVEAICDDLRIDDRDGWTTVTGERRVRQLGS